MNKRQVERIMLEGIGPVILGVAATNRPHLPLPPMGVVKIDGQSYIRVPFLRKGVFKHPTGNLIFNDKIFERMMDNHYQGQSHYGVSLDIRHKPELGSLAWFDEDKGGFIREEHDPKFGDLLVGYGLPTSEQAVDIIKNKQYAYASVEFSPNYSSNMIQTLSYDDLEELEDLDMGNTVKLGFRSSARRYGSRLRKSFGKGGSGRKYLKRAGIAAGVGALAAGAGYAAYRKGGGNFSMLRNQARSGMRGSGSFGSRLRRTASNTAGHFGFVSGQGSRKAAGQARRFGSRAWGRTKSFGGGLKSGASSRFGSFRKSFGSRIAGKRPSRRRKAEYRDDVIQLNDAEMELLDVLAQDLQEYLESEPDEPFVIEADLVPELAELGFNVSDDGEYLYLEPEEAVDMFEAVAETFDEFGDEEIDEDELDGDEIEEVDEDVIDDDGEVDEGYEAELEEQRDYIKQLEDMLDGGEDIQLVEAQEEINELKRNALQTQVELIMNRAEHYVDDDGFGHSPLVLEIVQSLLMGETFDTGEGIVKLESLDPNDIADYYRQGLVFLLENMPGQVPVETRSEYDDAPLSTGGRSWSMRDVKDFWKDSVGVEED